MEFYSFSFGEMQVAQADADSLEIVAMDVRLAFKDSETKHVHLLTVHVQVPGGPDRTITDVQHDAYQTALRALRSAADHCAHQTPEQLKQASEKQLIATNKPA